MDGEGRLMSDPVPSACARAVAQARADMAAAMILIFDLGGGMAEVVRATDAARAELAFQRREKLLRAGWIV